MDQNFQTSFIPKRSLAEDRAPRPQSVSVFLFFATILFIASLAGAAFVFFYKTSLTNQVAQNKVDLQKAEGAFEGGFIEQLQQMDKRINAANAVLANHISVTPIFDELQQATLKTIQFTKFSYTLTGSGASAQVTVQMSGISQSYTAIALESAQLAQNKYIKNPIFANLAPNDQGLVLFDLTFTVDPNFVVYGESIDRASGGSSSKQSGNTATQGSGQQSSAGDTGGGVVSFPSSNQ